MVSQHVSSLSATALRTKVANGALSLSLTASFARELLRLVPGKATGVGAKGERTDHAIDVSLIARPYREILSCVQLTS